ncbi:hypothetical protein GCM10027590_31140 [Nocardiopsis nanhaiensis]
MAGVTVTLLGAVVAAWAAAYEEPSVPLLVASAELASGEALTESDVRVVHAHGVEDLDLVHPDEVVGSHTAVPIPAGAVVTSSMLADDAAWPGSGTAVVSLETQPGVLPDSASEGAPLLVFAEDSDPLAVRLHSLGQEGELSGTRVIELLVDADDAQALARAVAVEDLRLVLMAEQ